MPIEDVPDVDVLTGGSNGDSIALTYLLLAESVTETGAVGEPVKPNPVIATMIVWPEVTDSDGAITDVPTIVAWLSWTNAGGPLASAVAGSASWSDRPRKRKIVR
jgi:hypothetical protein